MRLIFRDKASLVLRYMLKHPDREWVARDFAETLDVGYAWAARVLNQLRRKGYLKGESRGRSASAILRHEKELIREWTRYYEFEQNHHELFYTPDKNIIPKLKSFFQNTNIKEPYAFTLHTGANLTTNYVRDSNVYLYLNPENYNDLKQELRKTFDLKELKQGGNIYIIYPCYKRSVFFNTKNIRGHRVVSNLQLYLDLYHFPQRGKEHAEYLLKALEKRGKKLGQ